MHKKLLIITGERSGLDAILPTLLSIDKSLWQNISIVATTYKDVPDSIRSNIKIPSFTGINFSIEIISRYLNTFREIKRYIKDKDIENILFIDNPDFNLLLAKSLHNQGLNLYYYIIPQIWAWRSYRINYLKRYFKKLFVIFPFEKDILDRKNINSIFVGHPKYEKVKSIEDVQKIRKSLQLQNNSKIISLFPGTRETVLKRHFDIFKNAAEILSKSLPDHTIIISDQNSNKTYKKNKIIYSPEDATGLLSISEFAVISIGSTTMEATFLNIPFIGVYKPDLLTYTAGKLFIKSESTIMPNILSGERFIPELISPYLSKDEIVKSVINIISNTNQMNIIRKKLISLTNIFEGYKTSEILGREIESILLSN